MNNTDDKNQQQPYFDKDSKFEVDERMAEKLRSLYFDENLILIWYDQPLLFIMRSFSDPDLFVLAYAVDLDYERTGFYLMSKTRKEIDDYFDKKINFKTFLSADPHGDVFCKHNIDCKTGVYTVENLKVDTFEHSMSPLKEDLFYNKKIRPKF